MPEPDSSQSLSWENLIYIVDFLWNSGQRKISLLEGELTRHPQGVDFILYLLQRGFNVTFITHGLLSPSGLEEFRVYLTATPPERFTVVCYLHEPAQTPALPQETQRLQSFLAVLGPWTQAGFIIDRPDFTLDFLFDYIHRFDLKRQLCLVLAHPLPESQGRFIDTEDMRRVLERLYSYRHLCETHDVRLRFACGFPLCRFDDVELGWLHRSGGSFPGGCEPEIVISPDMSVYPCLPLSPYYGKSLFEFDSMEQIDRHCIRLRQEILAENNGLYIECDGCRCQEDGRCGGGGMCHLVGRGIDEAPKGLAGGKDGISHYRLPQ
jgi:hypothetical protein